MWFNLWIFLKEFDWSLFHFFQRRWENFIFFGIEQILFTQHSWMIFFRVTQASKTNHLSFIPTILSNTCLWKLPIFDFTKFSFFILNTHKTQSRINKNSSWYMLKTIFCHIFLKFLFFSFLFFSLLLSVSLSLLLIDVSR